MRSPPHRSAGGERGLGSSCRPRRRRRGWSTWPSGRRRTGSATCGRSTATSCGRSRTSSTARSWPRPATSSSGRWSPTRRRATGPSPPAVFATLNEMYGNRTVCGIGRGDSAVRVTNGKPTTLATLREAIARDPRAGQRPQRRVQGLDDRASRGRSAAALEVWVAGVRAEGAGARPARSATGSSSSSPTRRSPSGRSARCASAADARRPRSRRRHDLRRRAGLRQRRHLRLHTPRPVPLVRRDGRQPRRRHRRRATATTSTPVPHGAHRLHQGPPGLRLQRARPGRQHRTPTFVPDEIVDRFCILGPVERAHPAAGRAAELGVDQFAIYLQHDDKDDTLAGLRRAGHPGDRPSTVLAKS